MSRTLRRKNRTAIRVLKYAVERASLRVIREGTHETNRYAYLTTNFKKLQKETGIAKADLLDACHKLASNNHLIFSQNKKLVYDASIRATPQGASALKDEYYEALIRKDIADSIWWKILPIVISLLALIAALA